MILDEILAHKRTELTDRKMAKPLSALEREAAAAPSARGFLASLRRPGLSVIAEVKRKSPAKGLLRAEVDPAELAATYSREGARGISVLTDERFFNGSDADLLAVRQRASTPVLRKDFIIDDYQVWEARSLGADAVLLIVRALAQAELVRLLQLAGTLGMDALVEVHQAEEIPRAVNAGAALIGINNRDLDTMQVDLATTLRLRPLVPSGVTLVSESGIQGPQDLPPIIDAGVDAILVGEALMSSTDPGAALRGLIQVGAPA